MAQSYVLYNGTGALQSLTVPFGYIDEAHVLVLVDNVQVSFTWVNATTVQATTTVGTANVRVKRRTPRTALVNFTDGSGVLAADLNLQATQARYIAEEQEDAYIENVLPDNIQLPEANIADGAITTNKLGAGSVTTAKLGDASVTLAKLANLATRKVIGRLTGSTGVPEAVSPDDLKVIATGSTAERDLKVRFSEVVNVKDFGALGDGANDDTTAFSNAIASVSSGGRVHAPRGTYKITGQIHLNADNITLTGDGPGNTVIKQYTASTAAIRVSKSFCRVEGLSLVPNLTTGVTGLRVAPANEADTATLGYINYNTFKDIEIASSDEGIYMAPGPDVAGADSQIFYNSFINVRTRYCKRGLYMADGPNASSAGVNRNTFISCRFAELANTGIHIRCGGTNQFFSCHVEGITTGTSPHAIPVGIRIEASGTYSGSNAENCFFGCVAEGCTREFQNDAVRTSVYGGSIQTNAGTAALEVQVGSRDLTTAQSQPLRINNALYAQHLTENANLPNDTLCVPIGGGISLQTNGSLKPDAYDTTGATSYKWASYNVAPQMTNIVSIGTQHSFWTVFGGIAEWHLRVSFRATVAATACTINLPTTPDTNFLGGSMSNFVGVAYITNGANAQLQAMPVIAGPAISLTHPSNWNTASNINEIHFVFRFRISR